MGPYHRHLTGSYDDEINFLDDSDLVAQYISSKINSTPTNSKDPTSPKKATSATFQPITLHTTAYGNDDDSVSTLGNHTTKKWSPNKPPSLNSPSLTIPTTISHSDNPPPSDDRSTGSVSTLNTRITSMEGQFQQLSGTMEHIKQMLTLIASTRATQDEDPRPLYPVGRGNSAGNAS